MLNSSPKALTFHEIELSGPSTHSRVCILGLKFLISLLRAYIAVYLSPLRESNLGTPLVKVDKVGLLVV